MELVPLKVKIGIKPIKGQLAHDYPDFNRIPGPIRNNMDWSLYIDLFGGWYYDRVAGHNDHDPDNDSPYGTWLGLLLVPEHFAKAAVGHFPKICEIVTEEKAEDFYNNRCTIEQPAVIEDLQVLQTLAARKTLGELATDSSEYIQALDVNHPAPGRRLNHLKTWEGLKKRRGITITQTLAKNAAIAT